MSKNVEHVVADMPPFAICKSSSKTMLPYGRSMGGITKQSAAMELRRRFPGITDNAKAREQARAIEVAGFVETAFRFR